MNNSVYTVSSIPDLKSSSDYFLKRISSQGTDFDLDANVLFNNSYDRFNFSSGGNENASNNVFERGALEIEKHALSIFAEYKLKEEKLLSDRIEKELVAKLRNYSYDDESMESVWTVYDNIVDQVSFDILGKVLQNIFIVYNDYPNILCGICKLLASLELEQVKPWGCSILIGLLNHKNETVKEYSVILLDNWKDPYFIPVLRNLDCHSIWLQDYIKDVLHSLGE